MTAPTVATGSEDIGPTSLVDGTAGSHADVAEADRYPGSPPFGDTEIDRLLFRGRARETDEVLHSILSYDLFLVYAVSGMGKTSLLTAGVLEPLRQRGYFPVMLRVNSPDTPMLTLIASQIHEAAASAGVEVERTPAVAADAPAPATLWDMLAELEIWRGNTLQQLVLIFDQFEELFTLPWSQQARADFIQQFGEVVRRHRLPGRDPDPARHALPAPNVKIVLCMREDFIGQLEELAVSVPQIMHRRFRLGALDPVQAEAAICEPAALDDPRLRTRRFSYTAGAATTMLTFLRSKDERGRTVLTDSVDPSQLQIICQHVERSILPGKSATADSVVEITENDLGGQDGLRRIVGDFYRHVLETFDARDRKSLRRLCETGFISQTGRRLSLEEGEIASHHGVSRDTLRKLVDLRLLRSEPRVGSVYYELAHDTLTGPILAYRDARRRARRRRIAVAAIALAAVAAIVVAVLLASRRDTESGVAGPAPATPLEIGRAVADELTAPDDTAAYEVTADEQPLVVEFRPVGFDGLLEVTPLSAGGSQTQDAGSLGAPEFAVLGAGTGRYRIELSGATPGKFELLVRPANTRRLSMPGTANGLRLASTGEPTVFELSGSEDQAFAVTVLANKGDAGTEMPRGVFVQIVAPDGVTTQVGAQDYSGFLSAVGGGDAGTYLLAIGDSSGDTKTTYDLAVKPVRITPVPVGGSADSRLTGAEPQTVFEIQSTADGALFFELSDRLGASYGEVQTPEGGTVSLDPTTFTLVSSGPGRYLVFVASEVPDIVTLSVDAAEGVAVDLDQHVTGTLDDAHTVALYRLRTPAAAAIIAEVISDATLDAVLSLVNTEDSTVVPVDFAATEAAEEMVLPEGIDDSQLLAVTAYDRTSGAFEFTIRPADVQPLDIGETVERKLGAGELALFTVDSASDTPFAVAATSPDGLGSSVSVTDPSGELFDQGDRFFVSSGAPGRYTITARNADEGGSTFVSVAPLLELPLDNNDEAATDQTIEGPGHMEAFALPFVDDPYALVTITTDEGLEVDAVVTDAFGNVIIGSGDFIDGTGSILVPGASESDRLIVTGVSGSGTFRVEARGLSPVSVTEGAAETFEVAKPGDAVAFSVGPSDGLLDVVVQPSDGVSVDVTITDSFGNPWPTEHADATSPATYFPDTVDGPVQLLVEGTEGRGDVTIRSTPIETTSLPVGNVRRGSIRSPGQVLAFEISIADDAEYEVSVAPSIRFDAQISALDPYGQFDFNDGFSEGEAEALSLFSGPGTYRVIVGGAGSTGDFQISVNPTE